MEAPVIANPFRAEYRLSREKEGEEGRAPIDSDTWHNFLLCTKFQSLFARKVHTSVFIKQQNTNVSNKNGNTE